MKIKLQILEMVLGGRGGTGVSEPPPLLSQGGARGAGGSCASSVVQRGQGRSPTLSLYLGLAVQGLGLVFEVWGPYP